MKFLENDIHQQLLFCAKKEIRGRERLALKFSFSVHLELRKVKKSFLCSTSIAEISNRYLTTFRIFQLLFLFELADGLGMSNSNPLDH